MSELSFNGDEELYLALGLEELTEPRTFSEDPALKLTNAPSLRTLDGFREYFEREDEPGSPAQGYASVAWKLVSDLERLSGIANQGHVVVDREIPVVMRPTDALLPPALSEMTIEQQFDYLHEANDGTKVYRFAETSATTAYRGALDALLHTSSPMSRHSSDNTVIYRARFHNPKYGDKGKDIHLWLRETKGADDLGEFYTIDLLTRQPEDYRFRMLPRVASESGEIFIPTGEIQRRQALDRKDEIDRWDEVLDIVLDTVGNQAKRDEILTRANHVVDAPDVLRTFVERSIHDRLAA